MTKTVMIILISFSFGAASALILDAFFYKMDRPVILGECRTDNGKYHRMKLAITLGYKWVEAVPSTCDQGGCVVIVGHTNSNGRSDSANETMEQPK